MFSVYRHRKKSNSRGRIQNNLVRVYIDKIYEPGDQDKTCNSYIMSRMNFLFFLYTVVCLISIRVVLLTHINKRGVISMILVDKDIIERSKEIFINGYDEENVKGISYDIHISEIITEHGNVDEYESANFNIDLQPLYACCSAL